MALPTLTGTGRLTTDPELRFSPSGTAVAHVNLAFNSRRKNDAGEWEDGDVLFIRATVFREVAENVAETLTKGTEVVVTGRVKLDQWEDKQTGDKRSAPSLLVDSIGPSIRYATATVHRTNRGNSDPENGTWSTTPATTDEPPF